jgi:hypothetical protein
VVPGAFADREAPAANGIYIRERGRVALRGRRLVVPEVGHRQTGSQWHFPPRSHIRAWKHFVVPTGGSISGFKGGIDTPRGVQNPPEQSGGRSIALLHSGRIRPLMHSQEQLVRAGAMSATLAHRLKTAMAGLMFSSLTEGRACACQPFAPTCLRMRYYLVLEKSLCLNWLRWR